MGIDITSEGRKTLLKIKNLSKATQTNIRKGLYESGSLLVKSASKDILRRPRQGKLYKIRIKGGRFRRHRASVRGEAWANLSGTARRGLKFKVAGASKLTFFNRVDYVEALENERALNRPAMKISLEKNTRNIEKILDNHISRAF